MDRLEVEFSASLPWTGRGAESVKASSFTEAQRAFVLKQGEAGTPVAEVLEGRVQPDDILLLEEEGRQAVARRDAPAEGARGRECAAKEDCGRSDAGS